MRSEKFIEQVAEEPPHSNGRGQHEPEGTQSSNLPEVDFRGWFIWHFLPNHTIIFILKKKRFDEPLFNGQLEENIRRKSRKLSD